MILDTERLILRPWTEDDRAAFASMAQDSEMVRYITGGVPFTEADVDEFLARQERQLREFGVCMGAMVEKASGEVVGVAGIQPLGTTGNMEIGWWLLRDRRGRGYATEAGRAAMRHVLETLGQPRVAAIIDPPNEPSKRVVARLGMRYEGRVTGAELGHRRPQIVVDLFLKDAAP